MRLQCGRRDGDPVRVAGRDGERERGAASRLGLYGQLTAMRLDDAAGYGEAESRASPRGVRNLDERLEDPGQVVSRDAHPRVGHRHGHLAGAAFRTYGNRAAGWRGTRRVRNQIEDD